MQGDPERMRRKLAVVNYYRLSGYWFPFKSTKVDESFVDDTRFDKVWERYCFDRKLRLQVLDAVERVEVAVRARLAYSHAHDHGTFAYANEATSLPDFKDEENRQRFAKTVRSESKRSKERFTKHFREHYAEDKGVLPVWMVAEVISFGTLCHFYGACKRSLRQQVASTFGINEKMLGSWMLSLNSTRNICAHHGRLWNRVLPLKPSLPRKRKHPAWHTPVEITNTKVFGTLTMLGYLLEQIAPHSLWKSRIVALLAEYPTMPTDEMGLQKNWQSSPLWVLPAPAKN